jgi:hypothetical protein
LEPLLQRLEVIIERETHKELCPEKRRVIEDMIGTLADTYRIDFAAELTKVETFSDRLAELTAPLPRQIEMLEDEQVRAWAIHGLGGLRLDERQYEDLLLGLRKLARRAPPPRPSTKRRGRPPKFDSLETVVLWLVRLWRKMTGKRATRNWHGREPANHAMMFVHAVVGFIDAKRLDDLPAVTRKVLED